MYGDRDTLRAVMVGVVMKMPVVDSVRTCCFESVGHDECRL